MKNYGHFLIKTYTKKYNDVFQLDIISSTELEDFDDNNKYECYKMAINKWLIQKLIDIEQLINTYQNHNLYNNFLKNNKPIFLERDDLIGWYFGSSGPKTRKILKSHLYKVVIIKKGT
jgi:hypothetical protein